MPTRTANAEWKGGVKGQGSFRGQTGLGGAVQLQLTVRERRGLQSRGAARRGRSGVLQHGAELRPREGRASRRRACETKADCTIEKVGEGFKITRMMLTVRASVPNVDPAKFQSIAQATKEGCPVSSALKGNVQIDLDAKLV